MRESDNSLFFEDHINRIKSIQDVNKQNWSDPILPSQEELKYKEATGELGLGVERIYYHQYFKNYIRPNVSQVKQDIKNYTLKHKLYIVLYYKKHFLRMTFNNLKNTEYECFKSIIIFTYPDDKVERNMLFQCFKFIIKQRPIEDQLLIQYKAVFTKKQYKILYNLNQQQPTTYLELAQWLFDKDKDNISEAYEYYIASITQSQHYLDYQKTHQFLPNYDCGIDLVNDEQRIVYQIKWKWQQKVFQYGHLATFLAASLQFFPSYQKVLICSEFHEVDGLLKNYFNIKFQVIKCPFNYDIEN